MMCHDTWSGPPRNWSLPDYQDIQNGEAAQSTMTRSICTLHMISDLARNGTRLNLLQRVSCDANTPRRRAAVPVLTEHTLHLARFSPANPATGHHRRSASLKPVCFRKGANSVQI